LIITFSRKLLFRTILHLKGVTKVSYALLSFQVTDSTKEFQEIIIVEPESRDSFGNGDVPQNGENGDTSGKIISVLVM